MKIIHTADVHLSKDRPERMEALEEIVKKCEDEETDLLLIAGDLFDSNADVEDLKTELRPLFSGNDFETLVIPGNHDNSAFRKEDYFGEDIEILTGKPVESREYEDLNVVGLPYTEKDFSEVLDAVAEAKVEDKTNILMIHCTLQGSSGGFGEETEYLPVEPGQLIQTGFDYVMSGHIHSSATRRELGETVFTYPGSPASVSESETGKREAWLLDTEEGLKTLGLDTHHFLTESLEVLPGEEKEKIKETVNSFRERDLDKASIIIEVRGFSEKTVEDIKSELEEKISSLEPSEILVQTQGLESASSLTESDIYREFKTRLEEKDVEKPEEVEKKFLRGLSRYER